MIRALMTAAAAVAGAAFLFVLLAGIFILRYWIGETVFWGKRYQKQGYAILLSRRLDAYLMDTVTLCMASPFVLLLCVRGRSALSGMGCIGGLGLLSLVLLLLLGRLLEHTCVFYCDEGLLLAKPFRHLRSVPWSELRSIQKRTSAQIYDILDQNGRRLAWFPMNQRTQPFLDLAQEHGIPANVSQGSRMALDASGTRRNGTLGSWDAVLARSGYARNVVAGFVPFQDFAVVLFMDRRLNEDNVIAINQDGTTRWRISDIITPGPVSCAALTPGTERTVHVMAVMSRQYHCIVYEIDVYEQRIVGQSSADEK